MSWKMFSLLIGLALAYGVLLPVMLGVLKVAKSADEQSERFYRRLLWQRGRLSRTGAKRDCTAALVARGGAELASSPDPVNDPSQDRLALFRRPGRREPVYFLNFRTNSGNVERAL